jgi:hypothetical protein
MTYQLTTSNSIKLTLATGSVMFLPAENNGTPEWREYQAWLDAGNTPEPAPAPPPPAPGPDYITFWDALTTSTIYTAIREQSFVSLPMNTLATELIALLGDAKAGRANEVAIQSSMAAILTTGTFTDAQLTELQTALESGHLETIYNLN